MRFADANDTPCPMRLARFGFALTGEFRPPAHGELFIAPAEGDELQEHEPQILGACSDQTERRHIVRPVSPGTQAQAEKFGPLFVLAASDAAYEEVFGKEFNL